MDPSEVKSLLESGMPTQHVEVTGDGSHFDVLVVSEEFDGLNPVKKQQRVYQCLNEHISSGSIHAVNMQTLTPSEWQG